MAGCGRRLENEIHIPVGLLVLAFLLVTSAQNVSNSIDPPAGFTPFLEVLGAGVQIYRCQRSGPSGSLAWTQVSAEALLYPVGTKHLSKHNAIGDHYFLERADAQGGRPTWSFKSSTVTGRLAGRRASSNNGDIPDLLLQSTSHSGTGPLSSTAYIERVHKRGGVAPAAATCSRHGKVARIPYSSHYVFSAQDARPPVTAPTVPAGNPLLVGYFGEGFQHYRFNGSAWVLFNATAGLFVFPGGSLVGQHYFLTQPDAAGGRPTFELFAPASIVTGRAAQVVSAPSPQEDIPLVLLETTSSSGSKYGFGDVSFIRRLSTRGGVAPPVTKKNVVGEVYLAPYTSVYWFYVPNTK